MRDLHFLGSLKLREIRGSRSLGSLIALRTVGLTLRRIRDSRTLDSLKLNCCLLDNLGNQVPKIIFHIVAS